MLIVLSIGTLVNKLLMSKEQKKIASGLRLQIVREKVKESLTQLVEYKSKTAEE